MKAGDVVLVRFPFTEVATTKKRPALLLAEATRAAFQKHFATWLA